MTLLTVLVVEKHNHKRNKSFDKGVGSRYFLAKLIKLSNGACPASMYLNVSHIFVLLC